MAALRAASQAWQEMDFAEAPALHSAGVEKRPSSGGDSGRSSRRCSVSLSSPTISEDAVSLAESMMASGATAELREAGRAGNEYIAVESSLTVYQDAGIELAGEDEGAINASGRAAQTRQVGWSAPPETALGQRPGRHGPRRDGRRASLRCFEFPITPNLHRGRGRALLPGPHSSAPVWQQGLR